nr:hypothetical protein [Tanacetum cinerariifolium]
MWNHSFEGICINCTYGDGKPVTCDVCEGPLRGEFCLFCDSRAKNSYIYDLNAYSFNNTSNNFNHLPQPQFENYLCDKCGNNSHYGYDCQPQFPFIYKQEPSYNKNFNEPEEIPELMYKLREDVRNIREEEYLEKSPDAVTTVLPTEEPEYSLSMGYEHLSTTHETEVDEVTEYSAKNLLPIPSECEVTSEDESECDMPAKDESFSVFTTLSNPLFDYNDDFTSSDDESLSDEDVPTEEFKVYLNPFFDDEEINSDEIDPHCFNAESDLIESLLNRNTFIDSSPKLDFLLKEFSGDLAHINPILPEIKEANFKLEEEIRFVENLLYDNSSPRPPKELNAEIADTIVESLPSSLIPVQDNDSQREEIAIVTNTDELLPPGFDANDLEGEINVLRIDNSILNSENELSDNEASDYNNLSFPSPPSEPPDAEFDFEPDAGEEISVMMNNNDELECFDPGGDIDVYTNVEDYDYFPFMFVVQIFYRISSILRIYPSMIEVSCVRFYCPGPQELHILSLRLVWGNPYP